MVDIWLQLYGRLTRAIGKTANTSPDLVGGPMSGETPRWAITYRSRIGDLRLAIVNVCDVMVDRPNDTATIREKVQAVIDETDNLANRLSKVDDPKINPFIQELREAWNEATKAID